MFIKKSLQIVAIRPHVNTSLNVRKQGEALWLIAYFFGDGQTRLETSVLPSIKLGFSTFFIVRLLCGTLRGMYSRNLTLKELTGQKRKDMYRTKTRYKVTNAVSRVQSAAGVQKRDFVLRRVGIRNASWIRVGFVYTPFTSTSLLDVESEHVSFIGN